MAVFLFFAAYHFVWDNFLFVLSSRAAGPSSSKPCYSRAFLARPAHFPFILSSRAAGPSSPKPYGRAFLARPAHFPFIPFTRAGPGRLPSGLPFLSAPTVCPPASFFLSRGRLASRLWSVFWRKNLSKKRSLALFEVAKIGKTNYNLDYKIRFCYFLG